MLKVRLSGNRIRFGTGFSVEFERTLRIPDDGKVYPLPPGLGAFPVRRVEDYKETVPKEWLEHGGVFIPMYQREAMWMRFEAREWKPNAVKIAVGKVNAVSGKPWSEELREGEEDYLVCPPQPWLDGINAGEGMIRQFVAMPLGMGYTVEGQVTGEERFGGIQIIVYEPKPGKFPDQPPMARSLRAVLDACGPVCCHKSGAEMGLAAGGKMEQKIYPDPHGIETWDPQNYGRVYVHIVNSMAYREITGLEPPPTPVTAKTYTEYGLPWFGLYDEEMGDVAAPEVLKNVKSVKEMDKEKGFTPQQDDDSVEVTDNVIIKYGMAGKEIKNGKW